VDLASISVNAGQAIPGVHGTRAAPASPGVHYAVSSRSVADGQIIVRYTVLARNQLRLEELVLKQVSDLGWQIPAGVVEGRGFRPARYAAVDGFVGWGFRIAGSADVLHTGIFPDLAGEATLQPLAPAASALFELHGPPRFPLLVDLVLHRGVQHGGGRLWGCRPG
jgi:hypothetical protein